MPKKTTKEKPEKAEKPVSRLEKIDAIISTAFPKTGKRANKGSLSQVTEYVPVFDTFDHWILGCGGLPVGRFGEVFGDKGAGKTSYGFACLAGAQKAGGVAILVETEKSLDLKRAPVFGVNVDELFLIEPDTTEEILAGVDAVLSKIPKSIGPNVLVWDSLASAELEPTKKGEIKPGQKAALLAQALPKLSRLARDHRFAIVIINQLRSKIGVLFGPSDTTPGGNALKFQCSWRAQFWVGKTYTVGSKEIGIYTTLKCVHSKVSVPFHKTRLRLKFNDGWDDDWALMNLGKDLNIVDDSEQKSKSNLELIRTSLKNPT
jgi:recombination protein RecA